MRHVNKNLSGMEKMQAQEFFRRIKLDIAPVKRIINLVDVHADEYFRSEEPERNRPLFNGGEAFFGVYGIGGNINKTGVRPDVDIMIATNMRYQKGQSRRDTLEKMRDPYTRGCAEPLWRRIYEEFSDDMIIDKKGELPDNYNLGITKGKCLISLTPKGDGRKIDIVYVKSMMAHGNPDFPAPDDPLEEPEKGDPEEYFFNSEAQFTAKDVDNDNKTLPKVLLYRASTHDIEGRKPFF